MTPAEENKLYQDGANRNIGEAIAQGNYFHIWDCCRWNQNQYSRRALATHYPNAPTPHASQKEWEAFLLSIDNIRDAVNATRKKNQTEAKRKEKEEKEAKLREIRKETARAIRAYRKGYYVIDNQFILLLKYTGVWETLSIRTRGAINRGEYGICKSRVSYYSKRLPAGIEAAGRQVIALFGIWECGGKRNNLFKGRPTITR